MKLCCDCRFFGEEKSGGVIYEACSHPANQFSDPIRGGLKKFAPSWLRELPNRDDICGMEARWFEKEKEEET